MFGALTHRHFSHNRQVAKNKLQLNTGTYASQQFRPQFLPED
jgi:hypothetical protein